VDLADAVLLFRDPNISEHGLAQAAKLVIRELGRRVILNASGVWDSDQIRTDEEWISFGRLLRERVRRTGWL
jgi:hypothetical protein